MISVCLFIFVDVIIVDFDSALYITIVEDGFA